MSTTFIRIDNKLYRLIATIDEGRTLYVSAGRTIAVEKFDMRPGGTEFDFQVNSRAFRDGRPEAIATMQSNLDREFMEARVKSNILGLPLSYGNLNEMRRQRRIAFNYGEIRPQVFFSRVVGSRVAWRIWFKRTYYSGNPSLPGMPNSTASARADGSVSIGALSGAPSRGPATGRIGLPTNTAGMLRV